MDSADGSADEHRAVQLSTCRVIVISQSSSLACVLSDSYATHSQKLAIVLQHQVRLTFQIGADRPLALVRSNSKLRLDSYSYLRQFFVTIADGHRLNVSATAAVIHFRTTMAADYLISQQNFKVVDVSATSPPSSWTARDCIPLDMRPQRHLSNLHIAFWLRRIQ